MNTSEVQKKHKVSTLDITDFCGVSDLEALSDDGISLIIHEVIKKTQKGWIFQGAHRNLDLRARICLYFTKRR